MSAVEKHEVAAVAAVKEILQTPSFFENIFLSGMMEQP